MALHASAVRVFVCTVAVGLSASAQTAAPLASFTRIAQLKTSTGGNLIGHNVVGDPSVLFDNGKYRMWYTSVSDPYTEQQKVGITYAESTDGVTWQPMVTPAGQPVLLVQPTPGGWDAQGIETPSVVKTPEGKYLMYYTGDKSPAGLHSWAIGMATSNDGLTWTKFGTAPILDGTAGGWQGPIYVDGVPYGGLQEPTVIYDATAGLYKMWFGAVGIYNDLYAFRMGYATSPNGYVWQKHPTPVLDVGVRGTWDDAVVSHVNVVKNTNGRYYAFYFGTTLANYLDAERQGAAMIRGSIGYAVSNDGITWTRSAGAVLGPIGSWEAWTIGGPSVLIENGKFKLWYFGTAAYNSFAARMGVAQATIPQ